MTPYANLDGGKSSVVSYELGEDFILIQFEQNKHYLYNYSRPGKEHVEAMKKLAVAGSGLNAYVGRREVCYRYADKY